MVSIKKRFHIPMLTFYALFGKHQCQREKQRVVTWCDIQKWFLHEFSPQLKFRANQKSVFKMFLKNSIHSHLTPIDCCVSVKRVPSLLKDQLSSSLLLFLIIIFSCHLLCLYVFESHTPIYIVYCGTDGRDFKIILIFRNMVFSLY
jgi:hypothetical protein